ncbi:hypothetical protein L484_024687 [Morus notabilis]|uniref:Uncharacterized protein n=1 Tax=Morus notabilis TaxID=981085 RepID=W9R4K9_9ROSA|nr:uncharacterized protein LOC21407420 [Morus notabilis]XP_024022085.1 uncharacterized protein LOC21407420 [Morus notabilis]EXB68672.1 hypothetical protein L484_024687 [Morus notabilis]
MGGFSCESESWVLNPEEEHHDHQRSLSRTSSGFEFRSKNNQEKKKKKKTKKENSCSEKKNGVLLELEGDELGRTKSLTDDDLEELKGCVDLGFGGFSYDEIPELKNTLPALELCYSMSQSSSLSDSSSTPIPNWKISSPGDHPEDVKARLKFWAQAVACTVKLCS